MSELEPTGLRIIATPETRPAPRREVPDLRRLEVVADRFGELIAAGIASAREDHTEINLDTARCIAHVLGRSMGSDSELARFARTGEGEYLRLRDEYLELYNDPAIGDAAKEWIDWFGTYLVQREGTGSGREFMNPHLPPKLEQLLVRTTVSVNGRQFPVNIPASWHSGDIDALVELLGELRFPEDEALQAFLSLPDVSAGTSDIMESFHQAYRGSYTDDEEALLELSPLNDWNNDLHDWCVGEGIEPEALEWNWNYGVLMERLRDVYEVVELGGRIYVFEK